MNFDVDFRPSPSALVFTVGALAISLLASVPPARRAARLNIIEASASSEATVPHYPTSDKPSRIRSVNSSAKGSSMGMAIEKFRNGLMNVPTVFPATPMLAAPNPKLSSGSVPEVKTKVKIGVEKTTAT